MYKMHIHKYGMFKMNENTLPIYTYQTALQKTSVNLYNNRSLLCAYVWLPKMAEMAEILFHY